MAAGGGAGVDVGVELCIVMAAAVDDTIYNNDNTNNIDNYTTHRRQTIAPPTKERVISYQYSSLYGRAK